MHTESLPRQYKIVADTQDMELLIAALRHTLMDKERALCATFKAKLEVLRAMLHNAKNGGLT